MGSEVEHHLLMSSAEHPRVSESRQTGTDLDGAATGVVEDTVVKSPSVHVPYPAGKRTINKSGPKEDEDHGGEHATTFSDGANDEGSRNSAEHHLLHKHILSQHICHTVTLMKFISPRWIKKGKILKKKKEILPGKMSIATPG